MNIESERPLRCSARRHDTYSAYRQGCRCPTAREDWRLYSKRRRQGRAKPLVVNARGTHRRIRALQTLGWTGAHIAAAAGLHAQRPAVILRHEHIQTSTAAAIARAYDALSMQPGPSTATRNRALARSWLPPLAWDDDDIDEMTVYCYTDTTLSEAPGFVDEIAVAEAIAGRNVTLTRPELTRAIARMTGMGFSAREIADRLGTTSRQVTRKRAAA